MPWLRAVHELAAVGGLVDAAGGDRGGHRLRVGGVREHRVEGLAAVPRPPLGRLRVVPERPLQLERARRGRSERAHDAPGSVPAYTTPSSAPGTSCQTRSTLASVPSGKRTAAVGGLLPGLAEVVGAPDLGAQPARRGAGEQPRRVTAGVDEAGVDLLHVEVRAGERPVRARSRPTVPIQSPLRVPTIKRPVLPSLPPSVADLTSTRGRLG